MIDVLFLSPPRRSDGSNYLFNNATLQLASFLTQHGCRVWIEPLVGPDWRERLQRAVETHRPRWAAISCKWWDTVFGATEVARLIRQHHPEVKLVTGGQTASSFAQDLILQTDFDVVITGDAEVPLLQLAQGELRCNAWVREGDGARRLPQLYTQPAQGGEKLALLPDLTQIAPPELLFQAGFTAPFVWTGKGCQSACTFCSGSAYGHKKLFNRTGFQYRPAEHVLSDMRALSPWTQNAVMFDFDPVKDPNRESYYLEIARQLPPKSMHAAFFAWTLPTRAFIAEASQLFASILVSLDAQTYSEPLRRRLSERNQLKPFASDLELMDRLDCMRALPNVHGVVYGILGLQTETAYDVERGESFMCYLQDAYHDVLQADGVHATPLSIEPDSLMDRQPEKYGMTRVRHGLRDYLDYTRIRFESTDEKPFQPRFAADAPHPYGVYASHEDPERVHRDFTRIAARVSDKAQRWEAARAVDRLQFEEERVTLKLRARSIFQDDWRLILWAGGEALRHGRSELVIDTTETHLRVPPAALFDFDPHYAWARRPWQELRAALDDGRIRLTLKAGPTTSWGFLQPSSAEISTTESRAIL